jgi:hypothetical protein
MWNLIVCTPYLLLATGTLAVCVRPWLKPEKGQRVRTCVLLAAALVLAVYGAGYLVGCYDIFL